MDKKELIVANENNLYALYDLIANLGNRPYKKSEEVCWVAAKPCWPNFIYRPNFSPATISDQLHQLATGIKALQIPPAIQIGPQAKPSDLIDHLLQAGFEHMLSRSAMAADLTTIQDHFDLPQGLKIYRIKNKIEIPDWISIASGATKIPSAVEPLIFEPLFDHPHIHYYIARLNGAPVGASLRFDDGNIPGIYLVAVPPTHRNQGIGTAITLAPLHDARQQGHQNAILQATPLGKRIYKRIGFHKLFDLHYYHLPSITFNDFMNA